MSDDIMFAQMSDTGESVQADDAVDSQKYLIFMTDKLKLGVVAEYVVEILTNQPITYLPMLPDYVRGIINMRGQMIPIVDLRVRLNLPAPEDNLVVVINLGDVQLGILADAVDQMLDCAQLLPND